MSEPQTKRLMIRLENDRPPQSTSRNFNQDLSKLMRNRSTSNIKASSNRTSPLRNMDMPKVTLKKVGNIQNYLGSRKELDKRKAAMPKKRWLNELSKSFKLDFEDFRKELALCNLEI